MNEQALRYLPIRAGGEDRYMAGVEYSPPTGSRASMNVVVLPELVGLPWDDLALALVHGLRPTFIRVSAGEMACNAHPYRVTVLVDERGLIREITQEVEILGTFGNGYRCRLELVARRKAAGLAPVGE